MLLALPFLICFAQEPAPTQTPAQEEFLVDEILAIINDQILTSREIEQKLANRGIPPTPEDRQAAYTLAIIDMFLVEGYRMNGGDPLVLDLIVSREIDEMLKDAGSISELNARLALRGSTMTEEKDRLRRYYATILFRQVELGFAPSKGQKMKTNLDSTPAEQLAYYQEHSDQYRQEARVRARIIILRDSEAGTAQERLREFRTQISSGIGDFSSLARRHSLYRPTVAGSTGLIPPDDSSFQEPIREFLTQAKEGDLSEVLQLAGSSALVLAEKVQEKGFTPFPQAQEEIARELRELNSRVQMRKMINRIRPRCYVWGQNVDAALTAYFPPQAPEEEEEL